MKNKKQKAPREHKLTHLLLSCFWFFIGFTFAAISLGSFFLFYFQHLYKDRVIPGIFADNIYIGERRKEEVEKLFDDKNKLIGKQVFVFSYDATAVTVSAKELGIGYNSKLLADQAAGLGKTPYILSNLYIILNSYLNGIFLSPSYTFETSALKDSLSQAHREIHIEPQDALFTVSNNRVTAFRESKDGKTIDYETLAKTIEEKIPQLARSAKIQDQNTAKVKDVEIIKIALPIKTLKPNVTTEQVNNLGIVEKIGEGQSYFAHSIPNRMHNISLAAARINGILVAPSEVFSFNQALGDVSKYTGYREAYIIKDGKTILGDGGGVCQVSTTLFRALLNSGLPITERHGHSYRVGYYEQSYPPGLDATVYAPSVDLKFKNDTGNYVLIQSFVDPDRLSLRFVLYGKKDSREVVITQPVITNQTPPPPPLYQDDPNLVKGAVKQIDFEAWGANVSFSRTVNKDGKVILSDTFATRYTPWQAVFLKGTRE